jgi:hypothetical protein
MPDRLEGKDSFPAQVVSTILGIERFWESPTKQDQRSRGGRRRLLAAPQHFSSLPRWKNDGSELEK